MVSLVADTPTCRSARGVLLVVAIIAWLLDRRVDGLWDPALKIAAPVPAAVTLAAVATPAAAAPAPVAPVQEVDPPADPAPVPPPALVAAAAAPVPRAGRALRPRAALRLGGGGRPDRGSTQPPGYATVRSASRRCGACTS
jgi:hypothetical protein